MMFIGGGNMSLPDIKVNLFGKTLANPVMGASGTVGYGIELSPYVDLNYYGAIVTKGISAAPRRGNPPPRIIETSAGLLNSIGLENIGARRFIDEIIPRLNEKKTPIIVNIFGETEDEYVKVAEMLNDVSRVFALELNLSCPNVREGGIAFGKDPKVAARIVRMVRGATIKPVIVKLTPNVTEITPIACAVAEAGADAVSLINTLLGMAIDVKARRPYFYNIRAGLSGPAIKPIALRMVWETAKAVTIPVIGIGGIATASDAIEFIMAGAHAIQVGTAHFKNVTVVKDIVEGMHSFFIENGIAHIDEIRGII